MSELTDEQLRIRIAEWCGYGFTETGEPFRLNASGVRTYPIDGMNAVPNYPASLDAMHEAEKLIDQMPIDSKSLWLDYLALNCGWDEAANHQEAQFISHYNTARATARQRAIALVRTIGGQNE